MKPRSAKLTWITEAITEENEQNTCFLFHDGAAATRTSAELAEAEAIETDLWEEKREKGLLFIVG